MGERPQRGQVRLAAGEQGRLLPHHHEGAKGVPLQPRRAAVAHHRPQRQQHMDALRREDATGDGVPKRPVVKIQL